MWPCEHFGFVTCVFFWGIKHALLGDLTMTQRALWCQTPPLNAQHLVEHSLSKHMQPMDLGAFCWMVIRPSGSYVRPAVAFATYPYPHFLQLFH